MPGLTSFKNNNDNPYSDHVLRYVLICYSVETRYHHTAVHTIIFCEDSVRDLPTLSEVEMNYSCNHCNCITRMEDKNWQFCEIYVNHYQMNNVYLTAKFTHVFRNILKFSASNMVCQISYREDSLRVIYLQFATYFFTNSYYYQLYRKYNTAYLTLSLTRIKDCTYSEAPNQGP